MMKKLLLAGSALVLSLGLAGCSLDGNSEELEKMKEKSTQHQEMYLDEKEQRLNLEKEFEVKEDKLEKELKDKQKEMKELKNKLTEEQDKLKKLEDEMTKVTQQSNTNNTTSTNEKKPNLDMDTDGDGSVSDAEYQAYTEGTIDHMTAEKAAQYESNDDEEPVLPEDFSEENPYTGDGG